ncbi:hypothetical protein BX666DRAFT_1993941 [Dichotomocladium elegans]|nr:hypothetical protein BX666DRAFT_1993941 [Dichotomocladium elegans]
MAAMAVLLTVFRRAWYCLSIWRQVANTRIRPVFFSTSHVLGLSVRLELCHNFAGDCRLAKPCRASLGNGRDRTASTNAFVKRCGQALLISFKVIENDCNLLEGNFGSIIRLKREYTRGWLFDERYGR